MTRKPTVQVTVRLPAELVAKLNAAVADLQVGRRWLIERLVAEGLDRLPASIQLTRQPLPPPEPGTAWATGPPAQPPRTPVVPLP